MARHRKTSRPRDASATREGLLDAATLVFAEQGFAGARVDEIAARAGVNKALIYAYYGDKTGIYRAVLTAHLARVRRSGVLQGGRCRGGTAPGPGGRRPAVLPVADQESSVRPAAGLGPALERQERPGRHPRERRSSARAHLRAGGPGACDGGTAGQHRPRALPLGAVLARCGLRAPALGDEPGAGTERAASARTGSSSSTSAACSWTPTANASAARRDTKLRGEAPAPPRPRNSPESLRRVAPGQHGDRGRCPSRHGLHVTPVPAPSRPSRLGLHARASSSESRPLEGPRGTHVPLTSEPDLTN